MGEVLSPKAPQRPPLYSSTAHVGKGCFKSGERQEVSVLEISVDVPETLSVYECHAFRLFPF